MSKRNGEAVSRHLLSLRCAREGHQWLENQHIIICGHCLIAARKDSRARVTPPTPDASSVASMPGASIQP